MQKPEGSHLFSANIIICELQQMDPTLIDLLRLHRDLNRKLSIMLNGAILIIHSKPIDPISPVYLSRHTLVRSLVRNAASRRNNSASEREWLDFVEESSQRAVDGHNLGTFSGNGRKPSLATFFSHTHIYKG